MAPPNTAPNSKPLRRFSLRFPAGIFGYLNPYRWKFAMGFVFLILSSLTAMLFPYLLGQLIGYEDAGAAKVQRLLPVHSVSEIIQALLVVFTSQAIFSFFRILLFTQVTESALMDLRRDAFKQLVAAPLTYFNENKVGELTSRIAADVSQLQTTFTTTLAEFIRQIITIVVGITALLWLSPRLSLTMLSVIPVVAILAVVFGRFIRKLSRQTQDATAQSTGIIEEALQGIQNVKAFTNEAFELHRFAKANTEIKKLAVKGAVWRGLFASFIILCLFGSIVFVIWQGVLLTQKGDMDQASFIAFIMYTIFLGASIGSLPDLYAGIQKAVGATERLMEIIDAATEPVNLTDEQDTLRFKGHIAFKNVHFYYANRREIPVLSGINLEIEPGKKLAIAGPSGAGKSTLVSLLLRFYDPVSGAIEVDGRNAQAYDLTAYRSQFAVVPQEVLLFNGTIAENIGYGNPKATAEAIRDAARQANALGFIESFPEGFNTLVGERGVQLSGGQRQRIAIARAVLRNPAILILDEATSALDSESEILVQQALERLMTGRTTIVIAHRLSTIRNADQIAVIQGGSIVQLGTHEALMATGEGLYYRLQSLQNADIAE
jgi:ABC-type multidrug transport system fused ATPase/permease subunit